MHCFVCVISKDLGRIFANYESGEKIINQHIKAQHRIIGWKTDEDNKKERERGYKQKLRSFSFLPLLMIQNNKKLW